MATTNYSGFDLSTLPKRTTKRTDLDAARSLLASVMANKAASDMQSYPEVGKARNAGLRAARLLAHVAPAGSHPSIRTFGLDKKGNPTTLENATGYGWAVSLKSDADEDAEAEAEVAE